MPRKKTATVTAATAPVETETEVIVAAPKTRAPRAHTTRTEKKRAEFSDKIEARNLAIDFLEQNPSSLSFDFLVENQLPMYVKNNLKVPGKIVFTIKNSDGKYVKLEIANCSIPQRLDDLLTWGALANAHSLKDSLRQGIILLCSPKEAEKELQSDYAKRKTAELNRSKFANLGGSFDSMMATNVSGAQGIDDALSTYAIKKMDVTAVNASTATNKMEAIINRFLDGSRTEEDTITEVLDNSRIFATSDWHLLVSKAQSKSVRLVDLAKQQLAVAGSIAG
jgi:hypothetical protein